MNKKTNITVAILMLIATIGTVGIASADTVANAYSVANAYNGGYVVSNSYSGPYGMYAFASGIGHGTGAAEALYCGNSACAAVYDQYPPWIVYP